MIHRDEGQTSQVSHGANPFWNRVLRLVRAEYTVPSIIVIAALALAITLLFEDAEHKRDLANLNLQEAQLHLDSYHSAVRELILGCTRRLKRANNAEVEDTMSGIAATGWAAPQVNSLEPTSDQPNSSATARPQLSDSDDIQPSKLLPEQVRLLRLTDPSGGFKNIPLHLDSLGAFSVETFDNSAPPDQDYFRKLFQRHRDFPSGWVEVKFTGPAHDKTQPAQAGLQITASLGRGNHFTGLATGLIPAHDISELLEQGNFHAMTALISQDGDLIGCVDLPQENKDWLQHQVSVGAFYHSLDSTRVPVAAGGWMTLWTRAPIPGDRLWWLIYQYDTRIRSNEAGLWAAFADSLPPVIIFGFGLVLAFMVRRLRRRNGQLAGLLKDIRGREQALEGTISLLNATLESSTDGIVAISNAGTVVNFNQRLFNVWRLDEEIWPFGREGGSPDALASQVQNVGDFLRPPQDTDPVVEPEDQPVLLYLKDGRVLEQTCHQQTVDRRRVGTVWSFRDVTVRERSDSAIKQHLHFLQVLIDSIPNPVYYKDIRGRYLGCNTAFEQVIGRSRDEIIGKSVIEVGGVPFAQQYYGHDASILQDRSIKSVEGPLVYADGTVHQVVFNKAVFFNADETLGGIVGALVDITERKAAERALRENESKYRTIFESANIGFAILTDVFHDCNRSLCEIWGCASGDIIGHSPAEFSPDFQPDGRNSQEASQTHIDRALLGERQFFYWQHRKKTGELIDCEVILHSVSLEGKSVLLASVTDISERKRVDELRRQNELALEKSERYFRGLIENSTDLVTVVALGGTILYVGPSVQRLLGYDPTNLIGKCVYDYTPAEDVAELQTQIRPLLTDLSRAELVVCRLRHRDGTYRIFEFVAHGAVDMDDNPVLVINSRDITERSLIEERIRASEENYRTLFEDASDGIAVLEEGGRFLDANEATCRMLGYDHDELLTLNARVLRTPQDRERYDAMSVDVRAGISVLGEWRFLRKDGTLLDIEASAKRLSDGRVLAFYRDLTERKAAERALRESELWLRTLVEATSDVFFTVGADQIILSLSPAFETVCGWRTGDWIGKSMVGLVHPEDLNTMKGALPGEKSTSHSSDVSEIRVLARDGSYRTMEIKFALVCREDSNILYVGVARDISERRNAQSEVRKLSRAIEQSPVSVVITDPVGAIEYVNPKFTELTGYTLEEVRGKNPRILKSGQMDDAVYADLWNTISFGHNWEGELLNRKKNGETYWEHAFISCLIGRNGEITNYVAVKQDITERIKRELEMRKLSAAVVQSANLIIITDNRGVIEYVNPKFSQVSGYSQADVLNRPLTSLNSGADDSNEMTAMWEKVRAGEMWKGVVLNEQKNGKPYYIRRTASPILDASGKLISILFVGEDITSEMDAQQKAMEADKLAAVGVLAAGVSHEFKNYLGGIIGNASFALDEINDEAEDALSLARDTLSQIIGMSEKANQVAMSLLTYSKARPEEFSPAILKPLVVNTINLVEKELRNRSIELVTYFEDTPEVNVSASKIQQLLLNLLLNAEHAIEQSGVITVALTADSEYVKLKVGDTGCGVPAANLSRIFDPFFSTKGVWGKDKVVGTGMGLAICRNVAREHNGDLTVESTVGVGTTFTLLLPLCTDCADPQQARLPREKARKFVVFSLDKGIVGKYFKDAAGIGVELLAVDDMRKLTGDIATIADLVICDARFAGKIELSRIVAMCLEAGLPYVMVNCGAMEYQLSHLYERALANFRELPELQRVNALVPEKSQVTGPTPTGVVR